MSYAWISEWRVYRQPLLNEKISALLPSALPGLYFDAEFSLAWRGHPKLPDAIAESIAIGRAQDAAERISARFSVIRFRDAQNRVNSELGRIIDIVRNGVVLESACVRLQVDPDIVHTAATHERRMRDQLLGIPAADMSIDRVAEFQRDVLESPGRTLAYWFMKHPERFNFKDYNDVIIFVEKMSGYDEEAMWVRLAKIVQDFVLDLRPGEKRDLIRVLEMLFETYGRRGQMAEVSHVLEDFLRGSHPTGSQDE